MLDHRLRRWSNIKTTLVQSPMFAGTSEIAFQIKTRSHTGQEYVQGRWAISADRTQGIAPQKREDWPSK